MDDAAFLGWLRRRLDELTEARHFGWTDADRAEYERLVIAEMELIDERARTRSLNPA